MEPEFRVRDLNHLFATLFMTNPLRRAAAVVFATATLACTDAGSRPAVEFASLLPLKEYPRAQTGTPRHRVFSAPPGRRDLMLGTQGTELLEPLNVQVAPDGNVFVLDFGAMKIREFSPEGRPVRDYGAGRGRGPGEFMSLSDMAVPDDSTVWALDPSGGRIVVFDRKGRAVRHTPLAVPSMRMEVRPDRSFVLLSLNGYLFIDYDSLGKPVREFGQLVPDQGRKGVSMQGEFVATDTAGIVFAPMRAGYLARFSRDGRLLFYTETVERHDYPPIIERSNGALSIAPKDKHLVTRDLAVQGDDILVLAPLREGGRRAWVVDVYALSNGSYRRSFRAPEASVRRFATSGDALLLVSDTTVSRWRP